MSEKEITIDSLELKPSIDKNNQYDDDTSKPTIESILTKHNISVDDFVKCLKRGLSATRAIKDRDGDIIDTVEDLNVQHKFFASGMELLGYLKGNGTTINNNFEHTPEGREIISMYRKYSIQSHD
jgi:hypothetical protein